MGYSKHPKRDYTLLGLILSVAFFLCLFLPTRTSYHWYWSWIIASGLITFIFYGIDKKNAVHQGNRIPELTFHTMAFIGGVFGGWIGRGVFRHKTKHGSFTAVLIIATVVHIVAIVLVLL
jgi:uncharacterized membrane protein YsdA (DUF1294 family)